MFRFSFKNVTKISTFQKQLCHHQNTSLKYYNIRAASSNSSQVNPILDQLPPTTSEVMSPLDLQTSIQTVVDPPFIEIGLGGMWAPYSLVESGIEYLHSFAGLPWWGTITLGTVLLRIITFPLFLNSKKYAIRSSNHSRKNQELLEKMNKSSIRGKGYKSAAAREYWTFQKETKTGFVHSYPSLVMAGTFMSCFVALRHICNVPLPSLEASSFLWLDSLTASDPYRLLPLTTGAVVGLGIHFAMKFGTPISSSRYSRYLKLAPIAPMILLPLVSGHLCGAIQIYMICNSAITAGGSVLFMSPAVIKALDIPEREVLPVDAGAPKMTFKEQLKESRKTSLQKTIVKREMNLIKKRAKAEEKSRKKELQEDPRITYKIGVDAVFEEKIIDFEKHPKIKISSSFGVSQDEDSGKSIKVTESPLLRY